MGYSYDINRASPKGIATMFTTKRIAQFGATIILLIAASESYGKQFAWLQSGDVGYLLDTIPFAALGPITVDCLALVAMVIRGEQKASPGLRKFALVCLLLAGAMSLYSNLAMAQNSIQFVFGFWTVVAGVLAEQMVSRVSHKGAVNKRKRKASVTGNRAGTWAPTTAAAPIAPIRITAGGKACKAGCTCKKHTARTLATRP